MKMTQDYILKEYLTPINRATLDKLRLLKTLKGVSFSKMARATRISKAQLVLIWNGRYDPTRKTKLKIAEFFDANPLELWEEKLDDKF